MDMTFLSAVVLFLLVLDPFGNIPIFVSTMKGMPPRRRVAVALREHFFAFAISVLFFFWGRQVLALLQLTTTTIGIAGGVVLLLIGLRMIFPVRGGIFGRFPQGEPFIVPLAIPCIAGPATLTSILLLASNSPERRWEWILAMSVAMAVSALIAIGSGWLSRTLGERGIAGFERLVGLLLAAISVGMFLRGIEEYVRHLQRL